MQITAIALLRIRSLVGPSAGLNVRVLEDAVLLDTGASFALDPALLSRAVHARLGTALALEQADPRGIFFLPHVAAPKSRTYDAVIAEVGEGGVWGPLPLAASPLTAAGMDSVSPLLGGLLEQMPSSLFEAMGAAARAQPDAFERASAQLRAAVAGSSPAHAPASLPEQLAALENAAASGELDVARLGALLENSGIDMAALQQLVGQVGAALARDPAGAAALAEKLFGAAGESDDDAGDEG